ncbi:unnamed protein product [Cuscuta epithymum]|uniref:CCHC-type domain-containing protein n=1 Tax=Cuscuta epithymum TaxID=186058 RepID=A0AAV0GCZ3_9ASTE|nr:unnamed protein product [Cuscuta epithymum]
MFEWSRRKVMTRIQVKRCGMERYAENVCPNIIKKIDIQRQRSRNCYPSWAGNDYIHAYFKKDMYLRVYENMIHPVPGMHEFEDSGKGEIAAPDVKLRRGRPKKKRRADGNDINPSKASRRGLTHTCKMCGTLGHNKRTCPKKSAPNPTGEAPNEARGLDQQRPITVNSTLEQVDHDMFFAMVSNFDTHTFQSPSGDKGYARI